MALTRVEERLAWIALGIASAGGEPVHFKQLDHRIVTFRLELNDIWCGRSDHVNKVFSLLKPPVIAIVDDDEAVREALFDLFQVEGLIARTFDGAVAFLADYAPGKFDCIVSDVRMPSIDGVEMQQRLRALGAAIPIIFITSSTDAVVRASALRDGAVAWFTKPVSDDTLLGQLRATLKGRDAAMDHDLEGD